MKATPPFHSYQDKYLNQMRILALKVTKDLDCTIFLFGSRARKTQRPSSDIDIGFSGLDEKTFLKTRDRLLTELEESIIPHRVDLVNMDTAPPDFKNIVMQEVVVWKQSSRSN